MPTEYLHRVRVRYAETDQMRFAHHASYYLWFEEARIAFLDSVGQSYAEWERLGIALPVLKSGADHHRPAYFGDRLVVRTRIESLTRIRMRFAYRVEREGTGEHIADGLTEHAFMDAQGRPRRLPAEQHAVLAALAGASGPGGPAGPVPG
jgi:acyl-CoA thioester hydrolase